LTKLLNLGKMSHFVPQEPTPLQNHNDTKLPLEILMRLQMWINSEFKQLLTTIQNDVTNSQYLRVMKCSPHPVLVTQPSVTLVCRVTKEMKITCLVQSFNLVNMKEIQASFDHESKCEELKNMLTTLNSHQTSICKGIPEEKLITWANRKNISQILIERFSSKVVFRDRGCSYVMLETDQADICRSCAMLLSTSSMDLMDEQELECPFPECDRSFKYQGALDKHILKHEQNGFEEEPVVKRMKTENDETLNHIKLEPEINVNESEPTKVQDDNDFLDRLLSDLDAPLQRRKKKRKKVKPPSKDFKCSDCGKAFYFQKNLFTHVVEKHGKSLDELPNLATMKEEYDEEDYLRRKKRRLKGEKDKPVVCDECGVSFKFASGLYNHRKRMHGDVEKKQCPHCTKEIKSCTLEQHIREEHGTPRFACQFCGKGFYYKSFMLNHQRLHTGDYKECICDLCGAVYKSVQVLNRHVRNAHQDLRNHKCMHCDKAFHNKQRLERHINSQHTKAKIWPCPVCHSRYDRKDNLRTHIRKNHSNVVNPDTVELNSIDNDGNQMDIKPKPRNIVQEPTINPETGELEGPGSEVARAMMGRQTILHRSQSMSQAIMDRSQSVHVAHDLLSLKYGEDVPQYRQIPTPDIKHEAVSVGHIRLGGHFEDGGQIAQYQVKLERPDIVMSAPQVMGVPRITPGSNNVRIIQSPGREVTVTPHPPPSLAAREGVVVSTPSIHNLHNPGYVFQHHNI